MSSGRPSCIQTRVSISRITVEEYKVEIHNGAEFPPVVVFSDGVHYWLADGFHRVEAAKLLGILEIRAEIIKGTLQDAKAYSAGANSKHGLRRTNRDKRNAVEILLRDPCLCNRSDSWIGRIVGIDHKTVTTVRLELGIPRPEIRETSNGRLVNTAAQGRRPQTASASDETQPVSRVEEIQDEANVVGPRTETTQAASKEQTVVQTGKSSDSSSNIAHDESRETLPTSSPQAGDGPDPATEPPALASYTPSPSEPHVTPAPPAIEWPVFDQSVVADVPSISCPQCGALLPVEWIREILEGHTK